MLLQRASVGLNFRYGNALPLIIRKQLQQRIPDIVGW